MIITSLHSFKRTNRTYWNRISRRYDYHLSKFYISYNKTIKHVISATSKESNILDIGCGTGIITVAVAPYVKHITGIDISKKMIEVAKKKATALNLSNTSFLQYTKNFRKTEKQTYDTCS